MKRSVPAEQRLVAIENDEGEEIDETVRVIDWNEPHNNDFFLASQFWISSPNGI